MELLFLLSLTAATKDVRIQSAYFVPGPAAIEAILAARKRGVRVQILVPGGKIDEKIVRKASRATWGPLLRAGVEIAEYQPTMMHCKLMIIDDLWVSIGSSNFDNRSFRLNDEANLNVLDPTFAAGQIQVFEADRKKAKPITYEAWKHRPLKEKVMEGMAWLVSWEL
jgi:cardiolipin synthase